MPAFPDAEKISTQLVREAKLSTPPVDLWAISALWPNLRVSEEDLDKEGYLIFLGSHGAELLSYYSAGRILRTGKGLRSLTN